MLRLAFIALLVVGILLLGLWIVPSQEEAIPELDIVLSEAELTLYPQADPEAIWHFKTKEILYEPISREAQLSDIYEGDRSVDGEVDFMVSSPLATIDAYENLRGEAFDFYLPRDKWWLTFRASENCDVIIDQREGRFLAPYYTVSGENFKQQDINLSINFDLTDKTTGSCIVEGTQQTQVIDLED